ncbi:uncharacterized protein SPPG_01533 [Spizellomyces punctatus DAOM BR117]|uniref:Peptidase M20 dimerisation domain-containing protein n=1 Tax=Spizellomyces punctatus (strain DAOM BR117) TaxID=645134 RepID=A0A0L0HSQ2_SPIPD|nr:uncharacterized protein SPPG_01533 [Spizellomyces punctatus DAOM BR117]KND04092.1 hypothetical protein SPPG_01533 [Spizellomyces punctatus DAOM BR117]|eukprot:XP_016612131.1 hypothetical protein SPPG_01533 [Spizellomyces punctatus DAOM BR117]
MSIRHYVTLPLWMSHGLKSETFTRVHRQRNTADVMASSRISCCSTRILSFIIVPFFSIVGYLIYSTSTLSTRQSPSLAPPIALDSVVSNVNHTAAHARFASAIRIPTVSKLNATEEERRTFLRFRSMLQEEFPLVLEKLEWDIVNELSLLLKWQGSEPVDDSNLPILFLAHQDVVPVGDPERWDFPPFGGEINNGYIHGRGTLDMKGMLMAQLESVDALLKARYQPRRTIYLAFGHDEEVSGKEGAARIAEILEKRGLRFEFIIDEGLPISHGMFPGINVPIAWIGIAEKGVADFTIRTRSVGGHASMPFGQNAIHTLSDAIARLAKTRAITTFSEGPVAHLLSTIAPEHPSMLMRTILGNIRIFEYILGLLPPAVAPGFAAMTRTTWATTTFNGGVAANVLPRDASANINVRIRPGESIRGVQEFIAKAIGAQIVNETANADDPRDGSDDAPVTISLSLGGRNTEPSSISSPRSRAYKLLEGTIRHVFAFNHGTNSSSTDILVAPSLLMGATDSTAYKSMSANIFRFQPVVMYPGDPDRIHGVNERISLKDYDGMINFFVALILNADQMGRQSQ